jgi:hypothetical protein
VRAGALKCQSTVALVLFSSQLVLPLTYSVEIEVDINCREQNHATRIFPFADKKHDGKLHNGFSIHMVVDPRNAKLGHYQANLIRSHPSCVCIKAPANCASFRVDHGAVQPDSRKEPLSASPRRYQLESK